MNYSVIYNNLMKKRISNPYDGSDCEIHHIIPKSLGGIDHSSNYVKLSIREHFYIHLYPKG